MMMMMMMMMIMILFLAKKGLHEVMHGCIFCLSVQHVGAAYCHMHLYQLENLT
jgi:hypothetical protein